MKIGGIDGFRGQYGKFEKIERYTKNILWGALITVGVGLRFYSYSTLANNKTPKDLKAAMKIKTKKLKPGEGDTTVVLADTFLVVLPKQTKPNIEKQKPVGGPDPDEDIDNVPVIPNVEVDKNEPTVLKVGDYGSIGNKVRVLKMVSSKVGDIILDNFRRKKSLTLSVELTSEHLKSKQETLQFTFV